MMIKKTLISFFSLVVISSAMWAQIPAATIPEFTFFKLDNSAFTNKNLETGKLLFFCFFDAGCEHCRHAIKKISQNYSTFNKTAIYLVTLDNRDTLKKFLDKYGKNLPGKRNVTILRDKQNEFINKFRPKKYPSIFLYTHKKKLLLYDDNEENMGNFLKLIRQHSK